jgi:hypothetical protein
LKTKTFLLAITQRFAKGERESWEEPLALSSLRAPSSAKAARRPEPHRATPCLSPCMPSPRLLRSLESSGQRTNRTPEQDPIECQSLSHTRRESISDHIGWCTSLSWIDCDWPSSTDHTPRTHKNPLRAIKRIHKRQCKRIRLGSLSAWESSPIQVLVGWGMDRLAPRDFLRIAR